MLRSECSGFGVPAYGPTMFHILMSYFNTISHYLGVRISNIFSESSLDVRSLIYQIVTLL